MPVKFNPDGPLQHADLLRIDNVEFFDKTRPPEIEPEDVDEPYRVKMGDRPDSVAFRRMGEQQYGWTIMLRNEMRLWPNDMVPGKEIQLPNVQSLKDRGIV